MNEPLMTIREVAAWLRLRETTLTQMARQGRIPAIRVGRYWRFERSDVQGWLDDQRPQQNKEAGWRPK